MRLPQSRRDFLRTAAVGGFSAWMCGERAGRKIEWDAARLRARNAPEEVNALVRPRYRAGYSL